jgi:predicted nucleotidyltransferase component of viral defense system
VDNVARLSAQDRRDLFSEAAAKLGMRPTIIEKDFWVCLVLKILFTDSSFKQSLVFKGGTSLSKVYGLIERFSEDIDLVLDWQLIGFGKGRKDPMQIFESKAKQDKFNKEINRLAGRFISETLCPQIDSLVQQAAIGLSAAVDHSDPQIVNIFYPAAFSESYIRPEVRLEIGPLASWVPSAAHTIRPYTFDVFPEIFENPACPVIAIAAERTFWEKATILHQEAHRPTQIPKRYSRHYYDVYKLALSPLKEAAFSRIDLLPDVVRFKQRFYPSTWARYELATPGSFKLLPTADKQIAELERDYNDMQIMLFSAPPSFASILDALRRLESEINTNTHR